jgi:hypothetical protein
LGFFVSFAFLNRFTSRPKAAVVGATALLGAAGAVLGTSSPAAAAPASAQDTARQMMSAAQYQCFHKIVSNESGWDHHATNASSGAYGLVQALPASKMSSAGADWKDNPATQIKWGLDYMNSRYGSPCDAWSFWQNHHWY